MTYFIVLALVFTAGIAATLGFDALIGFADERGEP